MATTNDATTEEGATREDAYANPVVRTYLFNRQRHMPVVILLFGLVVMVAGPTTGVLFRRDVRKDVRQRQRIDATTPCFVSRIAEQECLDDIAIVVTFFEVTNVEDVVASHDRPVLREVGPYTFAATERHASVTYDATAERVTFENRPMLLEKNCEACDWDTEITLLYGNTVHTASVEAHAQQLLAWETTQLVLNTGRRRIDDVFRVVVVDEEEQREPGTYRGRLFGDAFSANEALHIYDPWLQSTVRLTPTTTPSEIAPCVRSTECVLVVEDDCLSASSSCDDVTWEVAAGDVRYSLPYLLLSNGSMLSEAKGYDAGEHEWVFHVDTHFGFTLSGTTTYQANHWMEIDSGGDGYWVASHWMRMTFSAPDSDVAFIKDQRKRLKRIFYCCDLGVTLLGAVLVIGSLAALFCTAEARKKWATIRIQARSRARDPRLHPSQFKSLGKFLQSQMRRKRTPKSVASATSEKADASVVSQQSDSGFDDVRSLPATDATA